MNDNGNRYALAALKDKRATLAGEIIALKRQVRHRESLLSHVDATIRVFEPGFDVDTLPAKRPKKRVKLFRQGELGRMILDALRKADGQPVSSTEIVTDILAATGHGEDARFALKPRVRGNLTYLKSKGTVVAVGTDGDMRWLLTDSV